MSRVMGVLRSLRRSSVGLLTCNRVTVGVLSSQSIVNVLDSNMMIAVVDVIVMMMMMMMADMARRCRRVVLDLGKTDNTEDLNIFCKSCIKASTALMLGKLCHVGFEKC